MSRRSRRVPGAWTSRVEIDLSDAAARERLLVLYGRSLALRMTDAETHAVVQRTEGVTASFLKELLRRSMLESLHENSDEQAVTAAHVSRALDDLLDSTQQLTRSLLGVGNDPETLPAGGGLGSLPPQGRPCVDGRSGPRAITPHWPLTRSRRR